MGGYLAAFASGAAGEYLGQRGDDREEERDVRQEDRAEDRAIATEGRAEERAKGVASQTNIWKEAAALRLSEVNIATAEKASGVASGVAGELAHVNTHAQEAEAQVKIDAAKLLVEGETAKAKKVVEAAIESAKKLAETKAEAEKKKGDTAAAAAETLAEAEESKATREAYATQYKETLDRAAKAREPTIVPAGGAAIDKEGNVLHDQPSKPTKGSIVGADKTPLKRAGSKEITTGEQLRKEWDMIAYIEETSALGVKRRERDPKIMDWLPWRNSQVEPEFWIDPYGDEATEDVTDEFPSTDDIKAAGEWYDKESEYLTSDSSQFGMSEEQVKRKKATEIMRDRLAGEPTTDRGGMLEEGTTAAATKPTELSRQARIDGDVMFKELVIMYQADPDVSMDQIVITVQAQHPGWTLKPTAR